MNTVDVITRKRDGSALNAEEIRYMVDGYTAGDIPDYQMSAFLMAVYFQGMNEEETILLTKYMKESGDTVDLSGIRGIKVDKHSTGGVGDKTTLIAGPAAAACGVPVSYTHLDVYKRQEEDCYRFFEDVCTVNEIHAIAQRLQVAKLLSEDKTYSEIEAVTKASTATISRINKCLVYGADGYKRILQRLADEDKD